MKWLVLFVSLLVSYSACAMQYQLDNDLSQLSFVTIKKENIAEVSRFERLQGKLAADNILTVNVPVSSVNTGIQIRDERIQQFLFDSAKYPEISVVADLSKALAQVTNKLPFKADVDAEVSLHGMTQTLSFPVLITPLADGGWQINSRQAVIIQAQQFGLVAGINKLRALANLSSISTAVPVTFVLVLTPVI